MFFRIVQSVCHVRECRGNHSLIKMPGIIWEIWSLLQSQGNLTLFTDILEWRNIYLNHHFSPLYHYLSCETYMVQKPKEYQIDDDVCPVTFFGFFHMNI